MVDKQWYEEWFDSPYYHLLYENRSEEEAKSFISNMAGHLAIPRGAKVLDVACGKGRHSKTLANLGFDVTGIDLSKNSIKQARHFCGKHLQFEVWDMRKTYHAGEFDVVFNLFSSFGYFDKEEEDYKAVEAMHNELKPGGTLVLDYINTEFAVKHMKGRTILQRGDVQFHISKKVEKGFIVKHISFLTEKGDNQYTEYLKVINLAKFEDMFNRCGLQVKEIFGDYDLNPFVAATSPRLILVAQRNV